MKYYLILEPDEDGNPQHILNETEFEEFLIEKANDPIVSFAEYKASSDPNYWQEGSWFAARIIPIKLKPKEIIKTLEITEEKC